MSYCIHCGALIGVRWGQRAICPDCRAAELAAEKAAEKAEPDGAE